MVRRVKAGELCGTIAGLPWHHETERERKEKEEKGGRWRRMERDGAGEGGVGLTGGRAWWWGGGQLER